MSCINVLKEFHTKAEHAGYFRTTCRVLWLVKQNLILKFRHSYSQYGEDLEIDRILQKKHTGFYVDVGAYDPVRLSNTYYFYKKGWRGITIEPDPSAAKAFRAVRPEDLHLSIGLGPVNDTVPFYEFDAKTRSTFSKKEADEYVQQGFTLKQTVDCEVRTLESILEDHPRARQWDVLSLDTEGFELPILEGNDWQRFRPTLICIEGYENDVRHLAGAGGERKNLRTFLESINYIKIYDNLTNCIYIDIK